MKISKRINRAASIIIPKSPSEMSLDHLTDARMELYGVSLVADKDDLIWIKYLIIVLSDMYSFKLDFWMNK